MNAKRAKFMRSAALAVLTLMITAFASAQDSSSPTPQDSDSASPAPITKAVESSTPLSGSPKPAGRVYMALGSDRLFTLNPMLKSQLLFQMDLTEGYDDGIVLVPRVETYYTLWTPRLAFLGQTPKSEYVIQYAPAVAYFGNTPIGLESLQQVSADLNTEVNSYWGWNASLNFADGSYPVSLLSPFTFSSVNDIAVVDVESILLLSTSSYLSLSANLGLHWRPTTRDLLVVSTTYGYASFPPNNVPGSVPGHVNRAILNVNYTRSVSERLNLLAYGNAVHVFGPLGCTTYGGQLGASYKIRQGTFVSGVVGPEVGAAPCTNATMSYTGSLTSRMSKNWSGYVNGARTTTGALNPSLASGLTDTLGAGVMRQWGAAVDARVDTGYLRVESLPTAPNSYNAKGTFISGRVDWIAAPPLVLSLQYSRIYETITGVPFNRNQVFVQLQLRPNPKVAF
jgi:hypothetical protein